MKTIQNPHKDEGFSLAEVLVAIVIFGILTLLVAPNIQRLGSKTIKDSTHRIAANIRMMRSMAISHTSAYRIRPVSRNELVMERAATCTSANWTRAPYADEDLEFEDDFTLDEVIVDGTTVATNSGDNWTTWNICYTSRGLASNNVQLTFSDDDGNNPYNEPNHIEVFSGGNVQIRTQ